jgi:hypothetical protein
MENLIWSVSIEYIPNFTQRSNQGLLIKEVAQT